MKAAKIGNELMRDGGTATIVMIIEQLASSGIFNPQTVKGNIVTDSILSSTYTTAVGRYLHSRF